MPEGQGDFFSEKNPQSSTSSDSSFAKEPREALLNDTIGFIRDLPPNLIAAFRSTLEDSIESDILLHVVDAGDPWIEEKIRIVDETLEKIGAHQKRIYVFNKSDTISDEQKKNLLMQFQDLEPIFLSARSHEGINDFVYLLSQKAIIGG